MKKREYKVFPINILAFLRVAIGVTVGLAFPLYFVKIGLNPNIIGIITSGTALAYLFSPLLLRKVHLRIGIKLTLIIATSGFLLIQFIFQFFLEPLLVFLMLILDGIFLGMFWPVLASAVSAISNTKGYRENDRLKDRLMKNYSLSWNIGGIASYLIGTLVLFFISNIILMFRLALIYAMIGLTFAIIFQNPPIKIEDDVILPLDENIKSYPRREDLNFPVYIPLILICIYGFIIGFIGLVYPIKSEFLKFPLFTNYTLYFLRMVLQTLFISKSMEFSIKTLKKLIMPSLLIVSITIFLMGIVQDVIIFVILFSILGALHSFLYTFSFKLVIFRNIARNTSKYSTYFEALTGIGFFLAPIIGGFFASIDLSIAFYFLAAVAICTLIFFLMTRNKIITRVESSHSG